MSTGNPIAQALADEMIAEHAVRRMREEDERLEQQVIGYLSRFLSLDELVSVRLPDRTWQIVPRSMTGPVPAPA